MRDDPLRLQFGLDCLIPEASGAVVQGVLYSGSLSLVYGLPKSGKSFLATDLMVSIAARDTHWMGHKILRPGWVMYVACEGQAGFWKRFRATAISRWGAAEEFPEEFIFCRGRPKLLQFSERDGMVAPHPEPILAKLDALKAKGVQPVAIVIDTVFRSITPGSVNSSEHVNAYVEAVQQIQDRGIAVLLVHHATKEGGSPNGSVALMGASDTIIKTVRNEDGTMTWEVEMAKDDAATEPRRFKLDLVPVGPDPDGEEATSCVVTDLEETVPRKPVGRPKKQSERDQMMRFLHTVLLDRGRRPNGAFDIPPQVQTIAMIDDWREYFMNHARPDEEAQTKRQAFRRMAKELQVANKIAMSGNKYVWPVYESPKVIPLHSPSPGRGADG